MITLGKSILRTTPFVLAVLAYGALPAVAQWSTDPAVNLAVADRTGEQILPLVGSTSDGGTWIAWFDSAAGSYDVYVQRLDAAGIEQFPHNGLRVSDHAQDTALFGWDMIVDAADNAVLVFSDIRAGGDLDVYAYRVTPDGTLDWGANGVTLSNNADFEPAPRVAQASDGDYVFVWLRDPATGDGDIRMQRLAPDGTPRLAAGGVAVVTATGETPGFVDVVPDGGGNVVLSWVRDISSFLSSRHVRARKFSPTGAGVWASPVNVYDAFSVPLGYFPQILPDGADGALVLWHRSDGAFFNSFVQHLDANGNELFPHNGVAVSTTASMHHLDPTFSYDPVKGDTFVFWNERNSLQSQHGIYGQKLSATGVAQWGAGGIVYRPVDTTYEALPRSVPWSDGAIVVFLDDLAGNDRLVAVRVDGNGTPVWAGGEVLLATAAGGKSRYPLTLDGGGVLKTVWEDTRIGVADLYAQNVDANGKLGAVPGPGDVLDSLRVDPSAVTAGDLTLSWGASCAGGAVEYAIYEGALGDFASHVPHDCADDGSDLVEELTPSSGDRYYLVVPLGVSAEGSYGQDSSGIERPVSTDVGRCLSAQVTGGCP